MSQANQYKLTFRLRLFDKLIDNQKIQKLYLMKEKKISYKMRYNTCCFLVFFIRKFDTQQKNEKKYSFFGAYAL